MDLQTISMIMLEADSQCEKYRPNSLAPQCYNGGVGKLYRDFQVDVAELKARFAEISKSLSQSVGEDHPHWPC